MKRKLSVNELATAQWHKQFKHAIRRDKAELYFASQRKLKMKSPPIPSVVACVADFYELSYDRLINCRHNKIVTRHRWVVFYICKRILGYSFRKITTGLGLAEGTVYKGLLRFKELMLIDPGLEVELRAIRIKLNRKFAR